LKSNAPSKSITPKKIQSDMNYSLKNTYCNCRWQLGLKQGP